jgi:hypothetical protein
MFIRPAFRTPLFAVEAIGESGNFSFFIRVQSDGRIKSILFRHKMIKMTPSLECSESRGNKRKPNKSQRILQSGIPLSFGSGIAKRAPGCRCGSASPMKQHSPRQSLATTSPYRWPDSPWIAKITPQPGKPLQGRLTSRRAPRPLASCAPSRTMTLPLSRLVPLFSKLALPKKLAVVVRRSSKCKAAPM